MLASSPEGFAEEYAIHDHEGFAGYALGEYEGIEAAHEIACFIDEYPDFGGELLNNFGGDLSEARTAAKENYCGCYKSLADYAQELTEETTQIPENLSYYIDYEKMGRDMVSMANRIEPLFQRKITCSVLISIDSFPLPA